jgi:pilus assembly protein CpaE
MVDALRSMHPRLQTIVVVATDDGGITQRAMLAGACSAVFETCSQRDLEIAITKVEKSAQFKSVIREDTRHDEAAKMKGSAVAVISARGGSGKSYLATLLAATLARVHLDTLLLDGDIQFSDLGLLFQKSEPLDSTMAQGFSTLDQASIRGMAYPIDKRLHLLRFESSPLTSDVLASKVSSAVRTCRQTFDATVINTGGFWSLFQSNLLESCNCIVVTCDHTLAGIRATRQLLAHLDQLHVPLASVIVAVNRFQKRGVSLHDIESILKTSQIMTLGTFPQDACISMDAGQVFQVLDEYDGVAESCMVLAERISMMTGMSIHSTQEFDVQFSRVGLLQRVFGL